MVKICFSLGDTENALKFYNELLTYTTRAVTRNYSEKSINNILDKISLSSDTAFMERFYNITLTALEEQQNERLWLKTNLKLAKLWLDRKEYGRLNKILRLLHKACQNEEGEDDQSKGTHLLEVYAIEIQMYTETKNNKKLKVQSGLRRGLTVRNCTRSLCGSSLRFLIRGSWVLSENVAGKCTCLKVFLFLMGGCIDYR
jgi:COP9 signalosome complex subunit 2